MALCQSWLCGRYDNISLMVTNCTVIHQYIANGTGIRLSQNATTYTNIVAGSPKVSQAGNVGTASIYLLAAFYTVCKVNKSENTKSWMVAKSRSQVVFWHTHNRETITQCT